MKILQINKFFHPQGGADRHFLDLIRLLEQNKHQVVIFSTQSPKNINNRYSRKYSAYWPKYNNYSKQGKFNLNKVIKFFYNHEAVSKLKKLLKAEPDIQIAHLHNIYHHLTPAILMVLKKHKIPTIMTLHDYKLICPNYNLFNQDQICEKCQAGDYWQCWKNKCIQNSGLKSLLTSLEVYWQKTFYPYHKLIDKFIAPSYFLKNKFLQFNFPNQNIEVIHNFIQNPKTKPNNPAKKNYFIYAGRLHQSKGIDKIIKLIPKLNQDLSFYIVGNGPERKKLQVTSDKLQITNKVKFIGYLGPKEKDKMFDLIQKAKFVIVPSIWYENCSIAILEALALGKIVFAHNIGGNSELIQNNYNGFLYKNEQELIDKISNLAYDNELISRMENNALEGVKENFSPEIYYQKLFTIYQRIIAKS